MVSEISRSGSTIQGQGRHKRGGRWRRFAWLSVEMVMAALLSAYWPSACAQPEDQVKILLRYDDYTQESSQVVELGLFSGLKQLRAPLLVGVVPFYGVRYPQSPDVRPALQVNLDASKLTLLRRSLDAGDIEIALHGFSHRQNFVINNKSSELAGHSLVRQRQLLGIGRAALERAVGREVTVFVPPFNMFDASTLQAMREEGFEVLSAGMDPPNVESLLGFVPGTTYPQELRSAVETAQRLELRNSLIVVVMHPYDFVESGAPVPRFRKNARQVALDTLMNDLRWASTQPGVRFVSLSELIGADDVSSERIIANTRFCHFSPLRSHRFSA
jgi:predicted deacetylase